MSKRALLRAGAGCALVVACLGSGGAARAQSALPGTTVGFDTGSLSGRVLSTSLAPPPLSAQVRATAKNGAGQLLAKVAADGTYSLVGVPVGDYSVEAFLTSQWSLGTRDVTVTVSGTVTGIDFTFRAGTVHAKVAVGTDLLTATGASNAQIGLTEQAPPACNASGATCTMVTPSKDPAFTDCTCTLAGRAYSCVAGTCDWSNPRSFTLSTGADGNVTGVVAEGTYSYQIGSGQTPSGAPTMPPPGMQQSGSARIAAGTTTVTDGAFDELGTSLYETGSVGGTIQGLLPAQNAMVYAQALDNSGFFSAWVGGPASANTYSLTLPTRDYRLTVSVNSATVHTETVSIGAGTSSLVDVALTPATRVVSGTVYRDGQGIQGASVTGSEVPPAGLACNAKCTNYFVDPKASLAKCDGCPMPDGRTYGCLDMGTGPACYIAGSHSFYASTDPTGQFTAQVAPGTYDIQIYSGQEPGSAGMPGVPPMGAMQMGNVLVRTLRGVSIADLDVSLGAISYATGTISGAATSCGQPLPNVAIAATPTSGGQIRSYDDATGHYSIRVPVGDYAAQLSWLYNYAAATSTVHVSEGLATPFDVTLDLGTISGLVVKDGGPSAYSSIQIVEKGPAGCTLSGAQCKTMSDPAKGGFCDCQLGARHYFCNVTPDGVATCSWADTHAFTSMTGLDGRFTTSVFAGDYTVIAYAPSAPMSAPPMGGGQSGQIEVARWDASVLPCGAASTAESSQAINATTGVAAFGTGVTLTFPPSSPLLGKTVTVTATTTPPPAEVVATPPDPSLKFDGAFYDFKLADGSAIPAGQAVRVCLDFEHVDGVNRVIYHYTNVSGTMQWVPLTNLVVAPTSMANVDEICGDTPSFSWFTVAKRLVTAPIVHLTAPPSANADAACTALAHLDASATANAPTSFAWGLDGSAIPGAGALIDVTLRGAGSHVVTVTASNLGGSDTKSVAIVLSDVTPPTFSATLSPAVIWPPDGRMVKLTPTFVVSDNCAAPTVTLSSLISSKGNPADVSIVSGLFVRADRDGTEKLGRTYTATWRASDGKQSTTGAASVLVPHDQRKK